MMTIGSCLNTETRVDSFVIPVDNLHRHRIRTFEEYMCSESLFVSLCQGPQLYLSRYVRVELPIFSVLHFSLSTNKFRVETINTCHSETQLIIWSNLTLEEKILLLLFLWSDPYCTYNLPPYICPRS